MRRTEKQSASAPPSVPCRQLRLLQDLHTQLCVHSRDAHARFRQAMPSIAQWLAGGGPARVRALQVLTLGLETPGALFTVAHRDPMLLDALLMGVLATVDALGGQSMDVACMGLRCLQGLFLTQSSVHPHRPSPVRLLVTAHILCTLVSSTYAGHPDVAACAFGLWEAAVLQKWAPTTPVPEQWALQAARLLVHSWDPEPWAVRPALMCLQAVARSPRTTFNQLTDMCLLMQDVCTLFAADFGVLDGALEVLTDVARRHPACAWRALPAVCAAVTLARRGHRARHFSGPIRSEFRALGAAAAALLKAGIMAASHRARAQWVAFAAEFLLMQDRFRSTEVRLLTAMAGSGFSAREVLAPSVLTRLQAAVSSPVKLLPIIAECQQWVNA